MQRRKGERANRLTFEEQEVLSLSPTARSLRSSCGSEECVRFIYLLYESTIVLCSFAFMKDKHFIKTHLLPRRDHVKRPSMIQVHLLLRVQLLVGRSGGRVKGSGGYGEGEIETGLGVGGGGRGRKVG